jgi:hypothetical protein
VIIKILIHVVFNFIYNSYGHSFELFEILFTSVSFASYCEIVDFLGESYYLIFHISCVSLLRFVHPLVGISLPLLCEGLLREQPALDYVL